MIGTAFLSGIFGMAGGLILIGVLLVVFPLPTAMVLHAITQMASNGWRATLWWRHIVWKTIAFNVAGSLVSVGLWSIWLYVPDKAMALLMLGLSPFVVRAIPEKIMPRTFGPAQVAGTGFCRHDADADDRRHRSAARHHVPAFAASSGGRSSPPRPPARSSATASS